MHMISLPDFRELLGEAGHELTDEQVERVREIEYGLADAIFDQWLRKRNNSKQPLARDDKMPHTIREHNNPAGLFMPGTSGAERG